MVGIERPVITRGALLLFAGAAVAFVLLVFASPGTAGAVALPCDQGENPIQVRVSGGGATATWDNSRCLSFSNWWVTFHNAAKDDISDGNLLVGQQVLSGTNTFTYSGSLTGSTTYTWRIFSQGTSEVSFNTFTTNAAGVYNDTGPGAPGNLTATAGTGQVVLTWAAPSNTGGDMLAIERYEYRVGSGSWTSVGTALTATATGLLEQSYTFEVRGVNAVGTGTAASVMGSPTITPPPRPGNPPSSLGVTGTTATFTLPAVTGATSYDFRYRVSGSGSWTEQTGVTQTHTVTGLAMATSYEGQYRGVKSGAAGPWSASVSFQTPSATATPEPSPTPEPTETPTPLPPTPTPTLEPASIYLSTWPDRFPVKGETQREIFAEGNQPLAGLMYEWFLNGTIVPTTAPGPQQLGARQKVGEVVNSAGDAYVPGMDRIYAVISLPDGTKKRTRQLDIDWREGQKPIVDVGGWADGLPGGGNFILFLGPTLVALVVAAVTREPLGPGILFAISAIAVMVLVPGVSVVLGIVLILCAVGASAGLTVLGMRSGVTGL